MCVFFLRIFNIEFSRVFLDSQIEQKTRFFETRFLATWASPTHSVESFDGVETSRRSPMAGCLPSMIPNWALVVEIFIIEMLWSQLAEVTVTVLFFCGCKMVGFWWMMGCWVNGFSWFIVWLDGVV